MVYSKPQISRHRLLSSTRPRTPSAGQSRAGSRTTQRFEFASRLSTRATLCMICTSLFRKVRATRPFFPADFAGYRRRASPPGNGGRGLKLRDLGPRQPEPGAAPPGNGGRGLKLSLDAQAHLAALGIAPRQRGAWVETPARIDRGNTRNASPPGNGGRGLKPRGRRLDRECESGIAPRQRGAWVETLGMWAARGIR